MPGARFFPDARLNFAENLLRRDGDGDAIVFWGEDKVRRRMSWGELRAAVARLAAALKADGVGPGDRVAAYVPNLPETVIGMLAATSLGARSEEHTSELQSLMRISYAVFCLKNKNKKQTQNN